MILTGRLLKILTLTIWMLKILLNVNLNNHEEIINDVLY